MDVIIETSSGRQFTVEVWFFATVGEIKETIQKYHNIPVSKQTLFFNNQLLEDDHDTEHYEILQGSRLRLTIEDEPITNPHEPTPLRVQIKFPVSKKQLSLDVTASEKVIRLKERIQEAEGIHVSRFGLVVGSTEMQDHQTLGEHEVQDGADVTVVVKSSPAAAAPGSGGGNGSAKKMRVMVLPQSGTKKIPIEVNAADNVSELRKELQKLQGHLQFHLPGDAYFFIYKQNVMDEDRNFRWHDVRSGDTIEIFHGSISGGS